MRDRRSTFTKEYINNVVNPLGTRPQRATDLHHSSASKPPNVEERPIDAADDPKTMLMPNGAIGPAPEADGLALGSLIGQNAAAAAAAAGGAAGVQSKDTTWTKLFVGGLPYHTTDQSLREHFSVYGEIEEAVVITDRQTGKSRGYGFVIMGDKSSSDRACKDANPIIDGLPPGYVYQNPYITATAPGGLVPLPTTPISHAATLAAASQFYEYQNAFAAAAAAAPYTGQYANGLDAYAPYTGAAGAGYMPYTYALPQTPALPAATAGAFQAIPYQTAAPAQTLQEARLQ